MRKKEIKSFKLEMKDMDDKSGAVVFYYASFTRDLESDMFLKTAYNKTLSENTDNFYHNRDHKDAVGKPGEMGVDDKGVWCKSQLAIKTINGNDCYEQYKAGLIKGHSQEFETILSSNNTDGSGRDIAEVRLWGVTSVTNIPANLDTPTISVKSLQDAGELMGKINKMLHSGNISDAMGEKFLKEYNKLSELVKKHTALHALGIVHCASCKTLVEGGDEGQMFTKCKGCGKFVNKRTGSVKPLISPAMVKGL